nr:retrovirus-related Pol polyprotein from transposon TNT 1-94 [Tanacetum cinerariifolium]
MIEKQKDPMMSEKKVNTNPVDYDALNQLSKDFETRFVPQTGLSPEQAFWSLNSGNSEESKLSLSTTIVEVPKELPKVSMVNSSLKKLKFHLASFDMAVEQHCVEKNKFQNKMKDVLKENERLLEQAISTDIVNIVVYANMNYASIKETISKLKGKTVVNEAITLHPINPELLKIDVAPLAPKLRNNRTAHNDYLKHTQEEIATLREIVENEILLNPLNTSLDYAYVEVAFCQHTCFIHNLDGVDLLTGSRGNNLYTFSLQDMMASSPMCLLSKASKTKSWSKNEAPDFIIKFLKMIQNDVVERRNHTPIEAACTMLIYTQDSLFPWAETVTTACYTQNRSIIRLCHGKTPYELLHNKLPDLSFLHVFGTLCYPTNDSENLGKLQPKADIGIFIGYAPTKKAFRIYNKRTRRIVKTIHVDFDELKAMASEQSSSRPTLNEMTLATISSGLVQKPSSSTPYVPPSRNDWDLLFQPMFDELLNPPPSVDRS